MATRFPLIQNWEAVEEEESLSLAETKRILSGYPTGPYWPNFHLWDIPFLFTLTSTLVVIPQ